jgi:hypothetical protein
MEGSCSTGQSPQWAVVPVEEEEVTKCLKCFSSCTRCTGGWLGHRSSLVGHVEETVLCPPEFEPPKRRARIEALYQQCYPGFRSFCSVRSFPPILTKLANGRPIL